MSRFGYKAEGKLDSKYLLDLLNDYLDKLETTNDTKGIAEDDFKINVKANKFVKWFQDLRNRIGKNKTVIKNYNMVLAYNYIKEIKDKIEIYLQTNVLQAKQFFELEQTLKAINFDDVLPELDENRQKAIRRSEKHFLKVLDDIKYLKNATTEYILFVSPVEELKPFISDKVSQHTVNIDNIKDLAKQFVALRHKELTACEFDEYEYKFNAKAEDFYNDNITDNGIGEEVERFIREKMHEKIEILSQETILLEDRQEQIAQIDALLKRLKLNKIEQMMQNLIVLKTNLARAKEVVDDCKETINSSTMANNKNIFLTMDSMYYSLLNKCEKLEAKIKFRLQLVDKQKMFALFEQVKSQYSTTAESYETLAKPRSRINTTKSKGIATDLYDEEDEAEIHIAEDDGDGDAEDEIIIDDEK